MLNVSKRTAYMILAISIVVEVIGDAMLTASHGYDHALLGIAAIIAIVFSFFLFSKILHIIDLPIAYATWRAHCWASFSFTSTFRPSAGYR